MSPYKFLFRGIRGAISTEERFYKDAYLKVSKGCPEFIIPPDLYHIKQDKINDCRQLSPNTQH